MEARVEFRILGPLELVVDGRPVALAGGRQRMLLTLLLLRANEVVSTDRLIDGLWGAQPPATAGKVLQNAVSQLRRVLGDDVIVTRAPGYMLRVEPEAIDARRFETLLEDGRRRLAEGHAAEAARILRQALALWRGPPLDEFAYERFAETEIARLEELRLRALEERIEADLALGRHADVVGELERRVAAHPLRERPRGQLMLALYRSGRQTEALQTYQDGRRLLAEELGLEPGGALQRLEKQILTQDPALDAPPLVFLAPDERPVTPTGGVISAPRRSRVVLALAVVVVAAASFLTALLLTREDDRALAVSPNSLVKIDPATGEIVDVFRVGGRPFKPAIVADSVFVASEEDEILSRIDVGTGEVDAIGELASPAGVAAGGDGTLWVGSWRGNRVSQLDAETDQLLQLADAPGVIEAAYVAVGGGSVWVSHGYAGVLSHFDARTAEFRRRYRHPTTPTPYSAWVAFGEGAAWVATNGIAAGGLLRIDAVGGGLQPIEVGGIPFAVTVGFGAVWLSDFVEQPVANAEPEPGRVLRIDPGAGNLEDVIPVGKRPSDVAIGAGSVWVANGGETTISQIDPRTNQIVGTIRMHHYPHYLAFGHGYLWVSLQSEPFSF